MTMLLIALLAAPVLSLIVFWGLKSAFNTGGSSKLLLALIEGVILAILVKTLQQVLYPVSILQLVQASTKEQLMYSFLIIALIEEGGKFLLLRFFLLKGSYTAPPLQASATALMMSMGFAIFENTQIAYMNGLSSYSQLMLLSVIAHASFAIIMAFFINNKNNWLSALVGFLIPWILHGLFLYSLLLKANPENTGIIFKGMFFGTVVVTCLSGALLLYYNYKRRVANPASK